MLALAAAIASAADLTPVERQRNIESFERVWTTIRDKHWDPSYNGVNWQALHSEFEPKVRKAGSSAEAREAMQAMLRRLKQTHFNIVAVEAYEEIESNNSSRDGATGLDVRVMENRAIVTSVQPGSPAERAGLRPGWELRGIDGKDIAPSIEKIARIYKDALQRPLILRSVVALRLKGEVGSAIKLTMVDESLQVRSFEIERAPARGVKASFGHLLPSYVWTESRRPAPNTGYIAFNMFLDPENVMKTVGDAVASCSRCDGFIVDVRGNPGGLGGMAMGMAGWFVDAAGRKLGTMVMRDNKLNFIVSPRAVTFDGKLAILVDECSASTSEIFAGGMKDIGRARIFGTRTAGAALPSVFEKLPNGDGFQYAFANYVSESGKPLEGIGVSPDVEIPLTREALLQGRDPALDAALEWIGTAPKKD